MEHEKYYLVLKEFLAVSGLTVVQLAEKANMIPEMLKESFDTKSKLIIGNFTAVALGCRKVIEEQNDRSKREELQRLYTRYFEEYLVVCPHDFSSIPNPHFIRRIEEMAALAGETVHTRVRQLLYPEKTIPTEVKQPVQPKQWAKAGEEFSTKLNALLSRLNEEGQREVLKRVEELTYVPAYQNEKKN